MLALLTQLRERADYAQGYGPANVLALLRLERGHLRGLDLSQLAIRGSLSAKRRAARHEPVWGTPAGVRLDSELRCHYRSRRQPERAILDRRKQAGRSAAVARGRQADLQRVWQAHTDVVLSLDFSPDEHLLASGSYDGSLKLWDVESGAIPFR